MNLETNLIGESPSRPQRPFHRNGRGHQPPCRVPHITRPSLSRHHPVHVTVTAVRGLGNLRRFRLHRVLRQTLVKARIKGKARDIFRVVQYSLQRNHLHFICEADDEKALSRGMQGLNSRIARAINRCLARSGTFFWDRYHAEQLRSSRQTRNGLAFVLLNARHHGEHLERGAGWVDPFSSSDCFTGWASPRCLCLSSRREPVPVATARTSLLLYGWRRYGPLTIHERPMPRDSRWYQHLGAVAGRRLH